MGRQRKFGIVKKKRRPIAHQNAYSVPRSSAAEEIHNRGDHNIINSSAFLLRKSSISNNKANGNALSMLVIEQMWSELRGPEKGIHLSTVADMTDSCPRMKWVQTNSVFKLCSHDRVNPLMYKFMQNLHQID